MIFLNAKLAVHIIHVFLPANHSQRYPTKLHVNHFHDGKANNTKQTIFKYLGCSARMIMKLEQMSHLIRKSFIRLLKGIFDLSPVSQLEFAECHKKANLTVKSQLQREKFTWILVFFVFLIEFVVLTLHSLIIGNSIK